LGRSKIGWHPAEQLAERLWRTSLDPGSADRAVLPHHFLSEQPDLNWWNHEVWDAFDEIYRFWYDRGVAGFRIDVAHGIVKDRELRDNPMATDDDPAHVRAFGQRAVYNMERPEVHDVLRQWRRLADAYQPPRILMGETYVLDVRTMGSFYGTGDELHLAFNFSYIHAPFTASSLAEVVAESERVIPDVGWPVWTVSNHDVSRVMSRWCAADERKLRCALLSLLTLRGTPVLYYGDELGLPNTRIERQDLRDPVGLRRWPLPGRDAVRTPMPWQASAGAGFTDPGVKPWLPIGDAAARNVEDQRHDPGSTLNFVRDLIALRRETPDLRSGRYEQVPAPADTWAWRRGAGTLVALNLSSKPVRIPIGDATIRMDTGRSRAGERVTTDLRLDPWEGALCSLAST